MISVFSKKVFQFCFKVQLSLNFAQKYISLHYFTYNSSFQCVNLSSFVMQINSLLIHLLNQILIDYTIFNVNKKVKSNQLNFSMNI